MNINIAQAVLDVIIFWILTTPHEFAHAWVAEKLGDDTPRLEGRVTLNPLAHVDWIGTVLLPLITLTIGGAFLGWGRAVNTNPARLKGGYNGLVAVALAGPGSNVVFAAFLGLLSAAIPSAGDIFFRAAYLSLYLAIFNMLPIPPLDGSKFLLAARIPAHWYLEISRFGFIVLLLVMSYTGLGRWMSNLSFSGALALFRIGR